MGDTTVVGSYPNGASPYQIYDLAGNVLEEALERPEQFPLVFQR